MSTVSARTGRGVTFFLSAVAISLYFDGRGLCKGLMSFAFPKEVAIQNGDYFCEQQTATLNNRWVDASMVRPMTSFGQSLLQPSQGSPGCQPGATLRSVKSKSYATHTKHVCHPRLTPQQRMTPRARCSCCCYYNCYCHGLVTKSFLYCVSFQLSYTWGWRRYRAASAAARSRCRKALASA